MLRRIGLTLITIIVLAFALGPRQQVGAAPRLSTVSPLADFLPADTGVYVELRTGSLVNDLNALLDILRNADMPVPKNVFADVDQTLSAQFGRKLTIEDDILGMLGDTAALGVSFSDSLFAELAKPESSQDMAKLAPGVVVILSIKDDAKADALIKDVLTMVSKQGLTLKPTATKFNGADAQRYEIPMQSISLVTTKGYWILGTAPAVTQVLEGQNVGLSKDARFQHTLKLLPAGQSLQAFIGYRALQYQVYLSMITSRVFTNIVNDLSTSVPGATPMPSPTPTQGLAQMMSVYKVIDGVGIGLRGEGKVLSVDFGVALNTDEIKNLPAALQSVFGMRQANAAKPLSFKLGDKLTQDAIAVVYGSDLAGLYRALKGQLTQLANLGAAMGGASLGMTQAEEMFTRFEDSLKQSANIDLEKDILSWLGGEFAIEMTYNKSSEPSLATKGQWPFDHALVVDGVDAAKADAAIQKFVTLFDQTGNKPVKLAPSFYAFSMGSPVRVAAGTVNGAFVLSTGTGILGAAEAANGKGTLAAAKSGVWTRAVAVAPKDVTQFLYVDLSALAQLIPTLSRSPLTAQDRMMLRVFEQFESALIYSGNSGTDASGSAVLILK